MINAAEDKNFKFILQKDKFSEGERIYSADSLRDITSKGGDFISMVKLQSGNRGYKYRE